MDDSNLFERCLDRVFTGPSRHEFLLDEIIELAEDLRQTTQLDVQRLALAQIDRLTELVGRRPHPNTEEAAFALRVLYSRYFINSAGMLAAKSLLESHGLMVEIGSVLYAGDESYHFFYSRCKQHPAGLSTGFEKGEIIPIVLRDSRMEYYQTVLSGFTLTQAQLEVDD